VNDLQVAVPKESCTSIFALGKTHDSFPLQVSTCQSRSSKSALVAVALC
jgi:hypothetical protein